MTSDFAGTTAAVLILIGIIPFLFALLPWIIKVIVRRVSCCGRTNGVEMAEEMLNYLNFVAGGIFLGLILLHMIPEVQEEMAESLEMAGIKTYYPVGPFLVALGLVAFVVVEQIVMYCKGDAHKEKVPAKTPSQDTCVDEQTYLSSNLKCKKQHHCSYESVYDVSDHGHGQKSGAGKNSLLRTYALLIALSLHSVFEGMMIGFQNTESVLWGLFGAIVFHKCLVAFSLGSRLLKAMQQLSMKHYFGLIAVFCLMAPLGGTIAALLAEYAHSNAVKLTENVLTALATGSFMFVTFFEILKFDYDSNVNLVGVFCLIIGFGAYALELYWEGDSGHVH
jgi:zinc transporter 1/2/3